MTPRKYSGKCPCCGYCPNQKMSLQAQSALVKRDVPTEQAINNVCQKIADSLYKGWLSQNNKDRFIVGIQKFDDDIVYKTIVEFVNKGMYRSKDLPYLSAMIRNASFTKESKRQSELNKLGNNPPELK